MILVALRMKYFWDWTLVHLWLRIDFYWIGNSRVDGLICCVHDLEKFISLMFFLLIRVLDGYLRQFSLVATLSPLSDFSN